MKIEDQVTSRELSAQIQELGVEAKGAFEWSRPHPTLIRLGAPEWSVVPSGLRPWLTINAYTVPELWDMLPAELQAATGWYYLTLIKHELGHMALYADDCGEPLIDAHFADVVSPANALAKLLIWCIENGHVTTEEINERCV